MGISFRLQPLYRLMNQRPTTVSVVVLAAVLVPVWVLTGSGGML